MYESIGMHDWGAYLNMMETLSWVAIVGIVIEILTRAKSVSKQNRQIILLLFTVWAISSISIACIRSYDYFHHQRENLIQSIENQKLRE